MGTKKQENVVKLEYRSTKKSPPGDYLAGSVNRFGITSHSRCITPAPPLNDGSVVDGVVVVNRVIFSSLFG